jgi:heat-inducible transcriptional repressor
MNMDSLTERRREILKHLVEAYVQTATPVSSEVIARRIPSRVSSATIRNELAQLEDLGLVRHPHTSAGRMPTEAGYRYFVEHLMAAVEPPALEQRTIRHQFLNIESDVGRWALVAASTLAEAVRAATVVTLPLAPRAQVRSLELLSVQDELGLLVLIIQSGMIRQQLIHWQRPVSRDDLIQLSNRLSTQCDGCTAEELLALADKAENEEADVLRAAAQLLTQTEQQMYESLCFEGLSHVLDEPEFAQSQTLRPFIELLERTPTLGNYLVQASSPGVVRIIIGSEHDLHPMQNTSVVLARYGQTAGPYGVLAVLGPTRMAYWRAVSMVRFMSGVLDVMMEDTTQRAS